MDEMDELMDVCRVYARARVLVCVRARQLMDSAGQVLDVHEGG